MWKSLGVWLLQAVIEHVVENREKKQAQPQTVDPVVVAAVIAALQKTPGHAN